MHVLLPSGLSALQALAPLLALQQEAEEVSHAIAEASTDEQRAALGALLSALGELNRRLTESVDGYDRADRTIAEALAALAGSESLFRPMR